MKHGRFSFHKKTGILLLLLVLLLGTAAFFGTRYIRHLSAVQVITGQVYNASSASELAASVAERLGFSEMTQLSAQQASNYYALPKPMLEKAAVFTGHGDAVLREVAVFELSSAEDRELLLHAAEDRVQTYLASQKALNSGDAAQENYYFLDVTDRFVILVLGAPYEQVQKTLADLAV